MIDNYISRNLLETGELKNAGIFLRNTDGTFTPYKVKISSWFKRGDDIVLKLKTGKDYPFGHKFIYRSLEELI